LYGTRYLRYERVEDQKRTCIDELQRLCDPKHGNEYSDGTDVNAVWRNGLQ